MTPRDSNLRRSVMSDSPEFGRPGSPECATNTPLRVVGRKLSGGVEEFLVELVECGFHAGPERAGKSGGEGPCFPAAATPATDCLDGIAGLVYGCIGRLVLSLDTYPKRTEHALTAARGADQVRPSGHFRQSKIGIGRLSIRQPVA